MARRASSCWGFTRVTWTSDSDFFGMITSFSERCARECVSVERNRFCEKKEKKDYSGHRVQVFFCPMTEARESSVQRADIAGKSWIVRRVCWFSHMVSPSGKAARPSAGLASPILTVVTFEGTTKVCSRDRARGRLLELTLPLQVGATDECPELLSTAQAGQQSSLAVEARAL